MEEFEDDADGSGSDFDSISDMSSLGSFGEQYAVKKKKEESEKKPRKTKRKVTVDPVTGLPVETPKKKKTGVKKKKKVEGGDNKDGDTAEEKERRKTVRKSKKLKLKGLNDRVLGLDEDMEPFTSQPATSVSANPTSEPQPSPMSHTAQTSPLAVNTGGSFGSSTPNRAPSPKINVLGSSRISPMPFNEPLQSIQQQQVQYSIAEGYTAQPGPAIVVPVQVQAPGYIAAAPTAQVPTPTYVPAQISAPASSAPSPVSTDSTAAMLTQSLDGMNIRSNESSRNSSMNNDSSMGSSSRGTIVASAVSERRKAAAAARATKIAKAAVPKAVDEVADFSGVETSPEATRARKTISNAQTPSVPPIAEAGSDYSRSKDSLTSTANSTENDTPRRSHEPLKTVIASTGGSAIVTAATSPASVLRQKSSPRSKKIVVEKGDSSDSSLSNSSEERRRRRKKEKEKKKNSESVKDKEKEKERELQAEKEKAEAREKERRAEREKEEREKEREREARRRDRSSRRARGEELSSEEPTPPSEIHLPPEPTPVSKKSNSFKNKTPEAGFCKMIKSTTYLNAIKIAHSDVPKVLCASADSTVQIYTILDGAQLPPLVGHTDRVISLAVSNPFMYADKNTAAGKPMLKTLVASGSRDEQLRIWDMDTAKCLHSIHAHKSPIWAVGIAVRPNGDVIVVSTSGDGSMRSWNGKTGKKINNFKGHTDKILSVFIMNPLSDNPLVLSAGADKKIRVWELLTGAHIRMLEGHEDEINSVVAGSFSGISSLVPISHVNDNDKSHSDVAGLDSSKSTVIVSASKDLTVRVWDFRSGHLLFELLGHTACVYEVAIMRARDSPLAKAHTAIPPGTPIIVSCSEDATIKLWNLVTGKLVKSLKYHSVSVRGIDTATISVVPGDSNSNVSIIASCGWDKTIQFHELGEALYAKNDSSCSIM